MHKWQKILLLSNLNKVNRIINLDEISHDYWYPKIYSIKNAIYDTFRYSEKSNLFISM